VNVEEISFLEEGSTLLVKRVRPNFKALGPKAGGLMKQLAERINGLTADEIAFLEQNALLPLRFGEAIFDLALEDVDILHDDIPGWQVASQGRLTVALDTTITEALREKGFARELINRIQNIRKDIGLEVTDRIDVKIKATDYIQAVVRSNFDYIRSEILATTLGFEEALDPVSSHSVELDEQTPILLTVHKSSHGH